jgi:L-aspartate oxidase
VYVRELLQWGTRFARDAAGRPSLGREAAHSVRRVLHAGDATGREIGRVLWQQVSELRSVETVDHSLVTELLVSDGHVAGVVFFDRSGGRHEIRASRTLLATGGAGQVFRETTNPSVATGDGISLAYRAGARVADLEFVQFHPTALKLTGAPRFLISEALRGEGARLVNSRGEGFMTRYHPDGDLAPRDVVARSIVQEEKQAGGQVFLTLAHLDAAFVRRRFPTIAEMCASVGLDLALDPIPVGPAAHYVMGGVDTDEWGRTSLPGLFAAGEVACTGVHGANRLASNSLLEGLVFGARAGVAMQQTPQAAPLKADRVEAGLTSDLQPPTSDLQPLASDLVRDLMWRSAGLFRTREGLQGALARLDVPCPDEPGRSASIGDAEAWRQSHLATVARLMARAALRREESRGGHFRADFPQRDDLHWKVHLVDSYDHHVEKR